MSERPDEAEYDEYVESKVLPRVNRKESSHCKRLRSLFDVTIEDAFRIDVAVQRIILEKIDPPYEKFFPNIRGSSYAQIMKYLKEQRSYFS
jgi:hypothetical protein